MPHPLPEGDYLIIMADESNGPRHVAALSNNPFVMVIPERVHTPFPYKIWQLKKSGNGYTINNIGAREFAHPRDLNENSEVFLSREESTVFDIQPDGGHIWRIVVPERNLVWTEIDFNQDPSQGFIKLLGSEGSDKQRFRILPILRD